MLESSKITKSIQTINQETGLGNIIIYLEIPIMENG
jgi:hypothetical protein